MSDAALTTIYNSLLALSQVCVYQVKHQAAITARCALGVAVYSEEAEGGGQAKPLKCLGLVSY